MADQVGTTLRGYGRCPEYSEIFPSDTFDLGRSIPNRPRTVAEQVRPRWSGHDLSGAPDSGIGLSGDGRTCDGRVGRFGQSTFRPTFPQPIRRKRRASGRVMTVSDVGLDVRSEGAMWGTPRKRALFGPEGHDNVSSVSDVAEAQTTTFWRKPGHRGWTLLTWWRGYRRKWRSSGRSPDMVAPGSRRFLPNPRAGPGLHQHLCPCLRERLVGTSVWGHC